MGADPIADLRLAVSSGTVEGRAGRPIRLSELQQRAADRALAELQAVERHNALAASCNGLDFRPRRYALDALYRAAPPLKGVLVDRLAAD